MTPVSIVDWIMLAAVLLFAVPPYVFLLSKAATLGKHRATMQVIKQMKDEHTKTESKHDTKES